jgi:hypothetical protein
MIVAIGLVLIVVVLIAAVIFRKKHAQNYILHYDGVPVKYDGEYIIWLKD